VYAIALLMVVLKAKTVFVILVRPQLLATDTANDRFVVITLAIVLVLDTVACTERFDSVALA
jgi:hypothetical protein